MTFEKKENVYVQPDSKVYQVKLQQMIATSGEASTQSNEEYQTGDTSTWF